jgi:hypothetical protein
LRVSEAPRAEPLDEPEEDDPLDELDEPELEDDELELELDEEELDEEELDEEELEELDEEDDELELDELELELDEPPELEDEAVGAVGASSQPTRKAPAAIDAAPDSSSRNSRRSDMSSLTVAGSFLSATVRNLLVSAIQRERELAANILPAQLGAR